MKRLFLIVTALLCLCQVNYSQDKAKSYLSKQYDITGYRGFVDFGGTTTILETASLNGFEIYTSHGYQFNAHSFFGVGFGFINEAEHLPVFLDYRYNILKGSIVPFVGAKAGYLFKLSHGLRGVGYCFYPSVGVKFMVIGKTAINLSIGYSNLYDNDRFGREYQYSGALNFMGGFEF